MIAACCKKRGQMGRKSKVLVVQHQWSKFSFQHQQRDWKNSGNNRCGIGLQPWKGKILPILTGDIYIMVIESDITGHQINSWHIKQATKLASTLLCFLLHLTKTVPRSRLPSHMISHRSINAVFFCAFALSLHLQESFDLNRAWWDVKGRTSLDLPPPDETPMLFHPPAEGHLLPFACAHWCSELQLG